MSCTFKASMRSSRSDKVGRGELFEEERHCQRPSLASTAPAAFGAALSGTSAETKLKRPSATRNLAYTLPCMRAQVRKAELQQLEDEEQQQQQQQQQNRSSRGKGQGQLRARSPGSTPISPRSPGTFSTTSSLEDSSNFSPNFSNFSPNFSNFSQSSRGGAVVYQPPTRIPAPKPRAKNATAACRASPAPVFDESSIPTPVRSLAAARAAYKRSVGAVGRTNSFNRTLREKLDDMVDTFSSCASTTCTQLTPRDRSP
mmetsp:Transcript_24834/g.53997  ORF Transcript_24834/g.53997 Transcript_24834/m.53997 type:complete len:257 (-) Transcript_24834:592-1362(-)|eukprot:CAMPEP_0206441548 /NCGR_PEP_ID=MMETSP0324_2-20121206/13342_1 /ASSEMBLY_ACC=CAM_ASM_000836 /TAXON_ID=2866 /ORGANISM="Crypthecodinium cohnii, Strain Seligo" /LENGTH=256 /DNA_ID=CAMNT_0053909321 /DNA_START=209 /DNA_END=979 /DNA_ORIENTATION=-